MRWEKIGKDYVSGPWLIRRYGYGFMLLRNAKQISYHKTVVTAKIAAELNSRKLPKE